MKPIIIGTRGSELALWQANAVARALNAAGRATETRVIQTSGDRRRDVSLSSIGGKGLFIREIEQALEARTIDLAVHSLKDVPSIVPDSFALAGFLERDDARDAWLDSHNVGPEALPKGSVVGTSSPRRRAQLLHLYPDLESRDIRGNVETRIQKMHSGTFAAIVLAAAGLRRLGRESEITRYFQVDEMTPAAGQGIITIETLAERIEMIEIAEAISHQPTVTIAQCERSFLAQFEGTLDCFTSIAAHAVLQGRALRLEVFVSDPAGLNHIRGSYNGAIDEMSNLVSSAASDLIERGARHLLSGAAI